MKLFVFHLTIYKDLLGSSLIRLGVLVGDLLVSVEKIV